ncbi:MAG: hypothetical protein CMJ39_05310 [Phycisphaerae bacterium]|nr:hypothetical protein [Phycisphaerae bacterium]|tara:strand:+ start:2210 stop:3565 length:1356 start_codon:yes stop_codon:yes gene_type:complete
MLPLLLLAAVMVAHAGHGLDMWSLEDRLWTALSIWAGVPALCVILAFVWFGRSAVAIRRGRIEFLSIASRVLRFLRAVLVLSGLVSVLIFNGLSMVRQWLGDLVLVDELVLLLPVLSGYYLIGVAWYSVDRAVACRHEEESLATTRWSCAWNMFVIQVLLLLVPAGLILGSVEFLGTLDEETIAEEVRQLLVLLVTAAIFIFAPLIMRAMLSVAPLEAGLLRDRLERICQRQGVPVRDILSWDTGAGLVNAAVVGILGRLRYILLTRSMIRWMPEHYVEAVMAHEVGHARCHHIPWLLASIITLVLALEVVWMAIPAIPHVEGLLRLVSLVLILWLVFGWISRRFEWQADACAVRDLSEDRTSDQVITVEATTAMIGALQSISALNGDDGRRNDWRHGSIRLRCHRLTDLVGRARDSLPIDRVVGRIKITTVVVGLASLLCLAMFVPDFST